MYQRYYSPLDNIAFKRILRLSALSWLIIIIVPTFMYRKLFATFDLHLLRIFMRTSYMFLGAFSFILVYTLIFKLFEIVSKRNKNHHKNIHNLLSIFATIISIFFFYANPENDLHITKIKIPLNKENKALSDFKMVHITDTHIGPQYGKEYIRNLISKINELKPDVVFITGDLIDGSVNQLKKELQIFREILAPYGVYYTLGNHEYYWVVEDWIANVSSFGFEHLYNRHKIVNYKGTKILIAGIPDFRHSHNADTKVAIAGGESSDVKILLSHSPLVYKEAEESGYDLMLAGHTHSGQFFPWNLVVKLIYEFPVGLKKFKKMWINVSSGTGLWGPPFRAGSKNEIVFIEFQ